jgi:phosphoglycolate phosphatase-like HAD superfamily hydrolase
MRLFKYQVIIFDFDGVIVESTDIKTHAYAKLFQNHETDALAKFIRYVTIQGGLSRHEHFQYLYGEILKRDLCPEEERILASKYKDIVLKEVIDAPFVPGIIEFIHMYKENFNYYIASGTPDEELKTIVAARGVTKIFNGVYGSPDSKASIISKIITLTNKNLDEVVMIGDSITDYDGARIAGIPFIGRVPQEQENYFPSIIRIIHDFTGDILINHLSY